MAPCHGSRLSRGADGTHVLTHSSLRGPSACFRLLAVRSNAALNRSVQDSVRVPAFKSLGPDSFILKDNACYLKLPWTCVLPFISSLVAGVVRAGAGGAAWPVGSHQVSRGRRLWSPGSGLAAQRTAEHACSCLRPPAREPPWDWRLGGGGLRWDRWGRPALFGGSSTLSDLGHFGSCIAPSAVE